MLCSVCIGEWANSCVVGSSACGSGLAGRRNGNTLSFLVRRRRTLGIEYAGGEILDVACESEFRSSAVLRLLRWSIVAVKQLMGCLFCLMCVRAWSFFLLACTPIVVVWRVGNDAVWEWVSSVSKTLVGAHRISRLDITNPIAEHLHMILVFWAGWISGLGWFLFWELPKRLGGVLASVAA